MTGVAIISVLNTQRKLEVLAPAGRLDSWKEIAAYLNRSERTVRRYPAFAIAEVQMGLGRVDAALEWLDRASDERHMGVYLPSVDPVYEPFVRIRGSSRS